MDLFITTFVAMLVIVDPLGMAAIFSGLTIDKSPQETRWIALRAMIMAAFVLLFFGLFGGVILSFLGIEQKSFKIAGGLLLFYTAFRMVLGGHEKVTNTVSSDEDIAIYPMAIPLLAGPGVLTAFLLMLDEAAHRDVSTLYVISSVAIVQILAFVCLVASAYIRKLLGVATLSVMARVTGVLLAALSVQFILEGLSL